MSIIFNYGSMGASKSAQAIMTAWDYINIGKQILLIKSDIDTRDGDCVIKSRTGMSLPCKTFSSSDKMEDILLKNNADVVIIDECQFMTKEQVRSLAQIDSKKDIQIICYGLKNKYSGRLFEGSEELLVWADHINEIPTLCRFCGSKATQNLLVRNNKPVYEESDNTYVIGDISNTNKNSEYYIPVCRKHYFNPEL